VCIIYIYIYIYIYTQGRRNCSQGVCGRLQSRRVRGAAGYNFCRKFFNLCRKLLFTWEIVTFADACKIVVCVVLQVEERLPVVLFFGETITDVGNYYWCWRLSFTW